MTNIFVSAGMLLSAAAVGHTAVFGSISWSQALGMVAAILFILLL